MCDNMVAIYEALGFEETEMEDGQTVLGIEFADEEYALLTDVEGGMPQTENQEIIFAYYSSEDSFLWSASFKNSTVFKELWNKATTAAAKLAAIREHREASQMF